jgi:hypothetical protein
LPFAVCVCRLLFAVCRLPFAVCRCSKKDLSSQQLSMYRAFHDGLTGKQQNSFYPIWLPRYESLYPTSSFFHLPS